MTKMIEPQAAWATDCRDKYGENHDSGFAGRICLADGNLAWAAVIADGCGGSMEGLKVSGLAVQAFTEALRSATLLQLTDAKAREGWAREWMSKLHDDAFSRFRGGMSTFCGAVILSPVSEGASWKLFSINVGDSHVWKLSDDGKVMGINPDAPANHPNVEGRNPVRVVGVAPKADNLLMDIEEFPLPEVGSCWIIAGSDGFFAKKKGKDEVQIFGNADFRDICTADEVPFHEIPALALRRSLENAQKLDCAELMDNATVAMLGFGISQRLGTGVLPAPGKGIVKITTSKAQSGSGAQVSKARFPVLPAVLSGVAGLIVGLVLSASFSGGKEARPVAEPISEKTSAVTVDKPLSHVPDSLKRCSKCWREKGVKAFHWANDPKYHPEVSEGPACEDSDI